MRAFQITTRRLDTWYGHRKGRYGGKGQLGDPLIEVSFQAKYITSRFSLTNMTINWTTQRTLGCRREDMVVREKRLVIYLAWKDTSIKGSPTWPLLFLHIFPCGGRIKAMSGDLESSHCALSIGSSSKAQHQSSVNLLNSRRVKKVIPNSRQSRPKIFQFQKKNKMISTAINTTNIINKIISTI